MKKQGRRGDLVTLSMETYEYTGGAHGLPSVQYFHWDLAKQQSVKLGDLLVPGQQSAFWEKAREQHTAWLDEENLRLLRGDPEPEPDPPDPLDPTWDNTGIPLLVFHPSPDENENLVWRVPNPVPVKFYGDDGDEVQVTYSKSGRHYLIEDPPLGSGALALFDGSRGPIGRFVFRNYSDDLIGRWTGLGVKLRR